MRNDEKTSDFSLSNERDLKIAPKRNKNEKT